MFSRAQGTARQLAAAVSLVFILPALSVILNSEAQTTSGTIVGYVKDKTGKGIPEALVSITNDENGRKRSALTDETGYYVRDNLPPGTYKLTAQKAGFVDGVIANFPVEFNKKNPIRPPHFTLSKATVSGRVVDHDGNQLIDAKVLAIDELSGASREALTNRDGYYEIPELSPGKYSINVSWAGRGGISTANVAVVLKREEEHAPTIMLMDAVSDNRNPSQSQASGQPANGQDVGALVHAFDAARVTNFTERQIESLPLGGTTYMRTFDEFALLVAGVAPPPYTPGAQGPGVGFGVGAAGQFSVNGMRARSNNFSVDGSDNNDPDVGVRRQGFVALVPQSVESVKEVSFSTLLWNAEMGRNFGSQVNAVSKYGANKYHGTFYGFFTDSSLNAKNFFDYVGGVSGGENPFTRTQAGFVIGGPVASDRTQFFGSFEHLDVSASTEHHFATPTLAERSFPEFLGSLLGRTPANFSIVRPQPDVSLFEVTPGIGTTPLGSNVLSLYPPPNNIGGPYGENTYTQVLPADGAGTISSVKLTRQVSANNALDARYNFTNDNRVIPSVNRAIRSTIEAATRTQDLSLIFESTLSPGVSNLARFSYGRTRLKFPDYPNNPLTFGSESRVIVRNTEGKLEDRPSRTGQLGELVIEPFSPVGIDDYTFPQGSTNNTLQYADSLAWTIRAHSIKFGGDVRHFRLNSFQDRLYRPLVVYGNGAIALGKFNLSPGDEFPGRFKQKRALLPLPGAALAAVGLPSSIFQTITANPPDSAIELRFTEFGFFLNDAWHARPNFTLDYGLRYEYNSVPREANNRIEDALRLNTIPGSTGSRFNTPERTAAFDAAVQAYSQVLGGRTRIYDPDGNNLGPHLGFAWDPRSDGRTAIRGGYGIYYDTILGAVVSQSRNVFPTEVPITIGLDFDVLDLKNPGFFNIGAPPAFLIRPGSGNQFGGEPRDFIALIGQLLLQNLNGGGLAFTLPEKKLRTPYAQQWHLSVERELLGDFLVSAAYVGTKGTKLTRLTTPNLGPNVTTLVPVGVAIDAGLVTIPFGPAVDGGSSRNIQRPRPQPALGAIQVFENSASSTYHSLQLQASKRYSKGYTFTADYTWSHALDDVSDVFPIAGAPLLPQNSFNNNLEHADASFDVRHRFAASFIWDLPFYRHSTTRAASLLSGWQLASILQVRTGQPFTLNVPFDANLDGNLTDRPSSTDGLIFHSGHRARRVELAPGSEASDFFSFGSDGAAARNSARGDGFISWDVSLAKKLSLTERQSIQFRAEFFNVMNRANFGLPVRVIGAPGFGSAVETAAPARVIQFALKYAF